MPKWDEVAAAVPGLAEQVRERFGAGKHATMATLRADGSPRISGTEVEFADGELLLGSMLEARKAQDLLRDPRVALHSQGVDPPETNPSDWPGEAKVDGTVRATKGDDSHRFVVDVQRIVFTKVEGDELVVRWWDANGGEQVHRRR